MLSEPDHDEKKCSSQGDEADESSLHWDLELPVLEPRQTSEQPKI